MLLALTISPGKAILVAALYVLAHHIEGNVIQPLGVARAVKMHPAAVAVGVIAVDRLFGVVRPDRLRADSRHRHHFHRRTLDQADGAEPRDRRHGRDEHTAAELVPITSATAARHID